jgi:mRNA interferase RelE/StbE
MLILRTERFKKDFKRLTADVQDRLEKVLEMLFSNPRHPALRVKKMQGAPGIWELRVTDNDRVTFQLLDEGVLLRRIGTHDLLRRH